MSTVQYCPACGNDVIQMELHGRPLLIIEEFPELVLPEKTGSKFDNEWTPRRIIKREIEKTGLLVSHFDFISVYPHEVVPIPDENCYQAGLDYAISLIPSYKGVVVLGGDLCKTFTGYSLDKVQGLSGVESQYIPDGGIPRVFLQKMAAFYVVGNGEFEIGLSRFVDLVTKGE